MIERLVHSVYLNSDLKIHFYTVSKLVAPQERLVWLCTAMVCEHHIKLTDHVMIGRERKNKACTWATETCICDSVCFLFQVLWAGRDITCAAKTCIRDPVCILFQWLWAGREIKRATKTCI